MDQRNEALMATFDMLNDRMYHIEQTIREIPKLVRYQKEQLIKSQHLPAYMFDYPFDVVLDNTTITNFDPKLQCILHFECKSDMLGVLDNYKDEIRLCLQEWFNKEEQEEIYRALFVSQEEDIAHCEKWNIKTHHKYITNYILEQYLKKQFSNLVYILSCDSGGYYFVFKELQNVDTTVSCSQALLKVLREDISKIERLNIVADMTPYNTILWLWSMNWYDEEDDVHKLITKVSKGNIMNYITYTLRPLLTNDKNYSTRSKSLKDTYDHEDMRPRVRDMISNLQKML